MALINRSLDEITVKLVYYGPGLCGKTTNLERIYGNPKLGNKGKLISMTTETDRTLFFDFMPLELGSLGGQKLRVQLYTVPGQVFYDATRRLVLRGADGVVFVADSQSSMRESNLESLENLRQNLRINGLDHEKIATVFQYNKRDLQNVSSIEEMNEYLQPGDAPVVDAIAIQNQGVSATLRQAVGRILENFRGNVNIMLPDARPAVAPDLGVGSGVTSASTGSAKISVLKDEHSQRPRDVPAPAAPVVETDDEPFRAPTIHEVFATAVSGSPFADRADDLAFDEQEVDAEEPRRVPDQAELSLALEEARDLVRSLEQALDRARAHEERITKMFEL